MINKACLLLIALLLLLEIPLTAQIASSGPYELEKSVIAGGGAGGSGGDLDSVMTSAQAIAGTTSAGGTYRLAGGFWTRESLGATAALALVSGRVIDPVGRPVNKVVVTLAGSSGSRAALTNAFGYFVFSDIRVGEFYVLTVRHKRYAFKTDTYSFTLLDDLTGVEFQAINDQ